MDMNELLRLLGLRQVYDAYQRNIGQPVANVAGPFGRGFLGLQQPEYGSEEAYRTGQAVGNMPGPNVPAGAIKMAAQVPGLLDAIQAARNSPELTGLLGLTAYHGSPYRFSKFDPTKIGTGEGAQAYGYGHYFAESPGVAKFYSETLAKTPDPVINIDQTVSEKAASFVKNSLKNNNYDLVKASEALYKNKQLMQSNEAKNAATEAINALKRGQVQLSGIDYPIGSFYTVDIPDEMIGRMLDWDKPLGQQSETIQRLAKQVGLEMDDLGGDLVARFNAKRPEGAMLLREQGIPGIRYYDQASRTKDGGTRNFVVFPGEEEAIKMLKVE
jgi:hypothetical protein